jgi:hypothetical protein
MSTITESTGKVAIISRICSTSCAWSMCRQSGTLADLTAAAAACAKVGNCFKVEGKSWMMRGERLASAARTRAVSCSTLYLRKRLVEKSFWCCSLVRTQLRLTRRICLLRQLLGSREFGFCYFEPLWVGCGMWVLFGYIRDD